MDKKLLEELVYIAELYYVQGLTQAEISRRVHLHRTEISRMLKQARKLGIVQISINAGVENIVPLEDFFVDQFHLKGALIVPANREVNTFQSLGEFSSNFLNRLISNNTVIGLSWGKTLANVIDQFQPTRKFSGNTVVPMIGGPIGHLKANYQANKLVYTLSDKLNAKSEMLNSPAIVSLESIKKELIANPNNAAVLHYWNSIDLALLGIGSSQIIDQNQWQEFYKDTDFANIFTHSKAVGDMLSQPFTIDGTLIKNSNHSVIGLPLSELKKVPNVVGIADGKYKVESILGALRTGILDYLITTDITALAIKKLVESKSHM